MKQGLLNIEGLGVEFHTPEGIVRAVDGVDLWVDEGEAVGLVGESGCGKSVTALSILGLVPEPQGRVSKGRILFQERNLLSVTHEELRKIRGNEISMIFQEPMTSLNPVMTVGAQLAEPLMVHLGMSRKEALKEAERWLNRVKIPSPRERMKDFPHQLSGGMRQRVMIAMALECHPKLLIADEPTTALDVTIQAQILALIRSLKEELGMALLLITHDLGVVAQMTSKVFVMYAGEVVEEALVADLFEAPVHPYTKGLLRAMPPRGKGAKRAKGERLKEIPGVVPTLFGPIRGCRFRERCPYRFDPCEMEHPPLTKVGDEHRVRCWLVRHPERGARSV